MLNVGVFNTLTGGIKRFLPIAELYKNEIQLVDFACPPTMDNLELIKETGCEALLYYNPKRETDVFFKKMSEMGIRYLSTSSAGYDHFNIEAMKKYGIKGSNVPSYSPNAIAEHTVLLTLSVLRNLREQLDRINRYEYTIEGLMGREIRNMTIGVIGTGRIGCTTIKCLSGFTPKKIYAYSPHPKTGMLEYVEYTDLDFLYQNSDIIIFHCAYDGTNHHMVNAETISKMKDGVVLINTARGALFDTTAVLNAIKSGKIGGLGIDVIEGEGRLKGRNFKQNPIPELEELLSYYNVIYTHHSAFFTDEAYRNLSETAIENLVSYARTGECSRELVK